MMIYDDVNCYHYLLAITRVLTILEEIKAQNQVILLNQQQQLARPADAGPPVGPLPNGIEIPLQTTDQYLELEERCQEADVQANLVRCVSYSCGYYCESILYFHAHSRRNCENHSCLGAELCAVVNFKAEH